MMICVQHIGARSGTHSFPVNIKHNSEIYYVMYDADKNCIEQIEQKFSTTNSNYKVINSGVGEREEERILNINYDPNTSSFLNLNKKYAEYYYSTESGYDYIVGDSYSLVKKVKMKVKTLDRLCFENNVPYPDVLSMDTQGTELEILRGAPKSLNSSVAILTEVAFLPFYEDQPLFFNIDQYLIENGFVFCNFHAEHAEASPYRGAIGIRSKGIKVAADVLYLKSPEYICKNNSTKKEKYQQLMKLAYVALVYGMLEYALNCIKLSRDYYIYKKEESTIFNFLNDLYNESEKYKIFPNKFSDMHSISDSFERFFHNKCANETSRIKAIIKSSPVYLLICVFRKYARQTKSKILSVWRRLTMKFTANSSIEKILIANGMVELAKRVKEARLNV